MRPGFLLATISVGAAVLCAVIFISPRSGTNAARPDAALPAGEEQSLEAPAPEEAKVAEPAKMPQAHISNGNAKKEASENKEPDDDARAERHEAEVAARTAELRSLSSKRDTASVEVLLSEIKNPDEEIREAALDAIIQSGNRAVIPRLLEAAAQTENAQEKQAIVDAIEFMSLPTLTEVLSGQAATNDPRAAQKKP